MVGRLAIIVALLAVTAVHAASCPGQCLDSSKKSCSDGKFVKGLCPGSANIQCCVPTARANKAASAPAPARPATPTPAPARPATPTPAPARPATPAAQPPLPRANSAPARPGGCAGACQDKAKPCGAAYISGVCPGAANVQCCPTPAAANALPAPTTNVVLPNSAMWAPFGTIWKKYPHGEAEDVKRRIGGGINAAYITNTCTIRVSRALTEAGMSINPITLADGNKMLLVKGGNGVGLPIRVKEFSQWMVKRFGAPQVKVVNRGDGTEEVPQQFLGKKGLIKFDVRVWSDATGHFDLWDGEACAHNCYFDKAKEVWLWTIA